MTKNLELCVRFAEQSHIKLSSFPLPEAVNGARKIAQPIAMIAKNTYHRGHRRHESAIMKAKCLPITADCDRRLQLYETWSRIIDGTTNQLYWLFPICSLESAMGCSCRLVALGLCPCTTPVLLHFSLRSSVECHMSFQTNLCNTRT